MCCTFFFLGGGGCARKRKKKEELDTDFTLASDESWAGAMATFAGWAFHSAIVQGEEELLSTDCLVEGEVMGFRVGLTGTPPWKGR